MRQTTRRDLAVTETAATIKVDTNPNRRTLLPHSTLTHSENKRNIMAKTASMAEWPQGSDDRHATMKTQVLRDLPVSMPGLPEARPQLDHWNKPYKQTLDMRKTVSETNLMTLNKQRVKERSDANTHLNHILNKRQPRQTPFLDGQEVYLYSGQKHNCTEKQKAWMRETMSTQTPHTMYSYAPTYLSGTFEQTTEGAESVMRGALAPRVNDTYARLPGDNREVWRNPPPRPKDDYRKMPREVSPARGDELNEPFVDGEWHKLPIGDRSKPTKVHV